MEQWVFDVPPARTASRQSLRLQYSFVAPQIEPEPLVCFWLVGTPAEPGIYRVERTATPGGVYTLEIPPALSSLGAPLLVQCVNRAEKPVTIVFPQPDSVMILQYAGGFAGNYSRGMLMLFFQIAFLAAVGVTAGACFSTPVAAFTSLWLVAMISLGGVVQELARTSIFFGTSPHGGVQAPGMMDYFFQYYFRFLALVLRPFQSANTLEMLVTNRLIEWMSVLQQGGVWLLIGCGVLGILGIWILNHREMALQT